MGGSRSRHDPDSALSPFHPCKGTPWYLNSFNCTFLYVSPLSQFTILLMILRWCSLNFPLSQFFVIIRVKILWPFWQILNNLWNIVWVTICKIQMNKKFSCETLSTLVIWVFSSISLTQLHNSLNRVHPSPSVSWSRPDKFRFDIRTLFT